MARAMRSIRFTRGGCLINDLVYLEMYIDAVSLP